MKKLLRGCTVAALCGVALLSTPVLHAQVPQIISYQGRITVGSVNFHGTGQFKFALVDAVGAISYWSNDGSSTAGTQPDSAVSLSVSRGLYSVLLGDATLPNMTTVPATVFAHPEVCLRVWFNDGINGFQLLTPDQRIAAVGYALMAGDVPNGAITNAKIAPGAVGGAQLALGAAVANIAPGSISGAQLGAGAAAANLSLSGQSGVPTGGVVLSTAENPALVAGGFARIGTTTTADVWERRESIGSPAERSRRFAVWTGTEMIFWGWALSSDANEGGRYDPTGHHWASVSTANEPAARTFHSAVWTGIEMIVWGGFDRNAHLNDGGRYNPASNSWTVVSSIDAPSARSFHTAIWTGTEMIVWGGLESSGGFDTIYNDGARYNPATQQWTAMSSIGAPTPRSSHTALWTGSEMIVWGGRDLYQDFGDGARYNPVSNTWSAMSAVGAPIVGQGGFVAVWTGVEMILWSGYSGARYNQTSNTWSAVSTYEAPTARSTMNRPVTAVWTGSEMIVCGGETLVAENTGGRYSPASNSWTAMSTTGAPSPNWNGAVWTGGQMITLTLNNTDLSTGFDYAFTYTPGRTLHLYQRQ